jgi:hypothetical protein
VKKKILTWLAPGLLVLGGCSTLFAAPDMEMVLSDTSGDSLTVNVTGGVVTHSGTGSFSFVTGTYTTAGGLVMIGTVGQFNINTTAEGHPNLNLPTLEDLNQISASSTGPGVLDAVFTDTGYTTFGAAFLLGVSGTNDAGIVMSTANFTALGSSTNQLLTGTTIGSLTGLTGNPSTSYSATEGFPNTIGSSGSLTVQTGLNFSGPAHMQANFTISAVPESASVVLFGCVLLFSTTALRKKLRKV